MMNDNDALILARNGRQEGYKALYDNYSGYLFTLAYRMLKDRQAANDVVQETFESAFKAICSFRGESRLKTWLYTILYRISIHRLSRENHQSPSCLNEIADEKCTYELIDKKLDVERILNDMPPCDRAVLILSYWDDLSCSEMAGILSLETNHVKVLLFRARRKFQKLWTRSCASEMECKTDEMS